MAMTTRTREIAKFLSGIAFHETLGHWWLGTWGKEMLPWKLSWFTFTTAMNNACMVVWAVMFVALVWFGWVRKLEIESDTTPALAGKRLSGV